jgi:hypothetical protein
MVKSSNQPEYHFMNILGGSIVDNEKCRRAKLDEKTLRSGVDKEDGI